MDTMETSSADTLLSSKHMTGLRDSDSYDTFPALHPSSPHSATHTRLWHTASDFYESPFIALYSEADCPHNQFARDDAVHGGATKSRYSDPSKVYPSPPSGSSTPKSTVPLPEEAGEFALSYSTHLVGVLDSPTVMRRNDLACHRPLTPPPTMPSTTLELPDADIDIVFDDQETETEEDGDEFEDDAPFFGPSGSSLHSIQSDFPLSPLSPPWDPPCPQVPSVASAQDFSFSSELAFIWSPCGVSKNPLLRASDDIPPLASQEPCSLLELDAPCPFLAPISISWSPHQTYGIEHEPTTSYVSSPSLTDSDKLIPPNSPLISRLDLPELEDGGLPQIIPSSPCRRSCSYLPSADIEMDDATSNSLAESPGQRLLSLPGADTDDYLIPELPTAPFVPLAPSQPLLFIDDPRDVPLPRSPSPEDFELCLSPEDITDPELAGLFDLRKRSVAAERAARRVEALVDEIDLFTRVEAQKTRKRTRERNKEVGALLRLKLGDGVGMCPQEKSPEVNQQNTQRRRGVIGSIPQLVAQMVFRRNETSRPLTKRKTAMAPRAYSRSSLSRSVVSDV
ncbi:hypothetical protein PAXRUDRAFT_830634 [Paxillus rubicundulus Ve08.2h10]|uniref:Uncharacterized protein n=1 Tax=Paxillus rubicundulus Ve08.2h10 TaxID=930991 RepID=A0A0D0D4Z6_9AGAM|nr:hypothetical protein PAXRUDRAFT_830634 [Paxillus rubicundulus Ve08.2h10]